MKACTLLLAATAISLGACQPASEQAPAPAPPPSASAPQPAEALPDPALTAFLQARTADAMAPLSYVARTTGSGDDQLTLVYFTGPEYCGSGGCNLLILGRQGDPYAVLGEVTITRPPIRVLSTRTNGRPDIGVLVSGGGAEPHEALLAFDGVRYPSNPTVAPARRIDGAQGSILITEDDERVPLKQ